MTEARTRTKHRKKPVVVEAQQLTAENAFELSLWCNGRYYSTGLPEPSVVIYTPEAVMIAYPGDYIVKDTNGSFYSCKPDIFESLYAPIEEVE